LNSKLTSRDASFIRLFEEFGFSKPQLAEEYGVHVDTIRNVVRGKSFRGGVTRNKNRKLNDEQVRQIHELAAQRFGEARIAKALGGVVSRSTVRQVMSGKSYKDVV
jgi:transposase